jgi:hypothetical protein
MLFFDQQTQHCDRFQSSLCSDPGSAFSSRCILFLQVTAPSNLPSSPMFAVDGGAFAGLLPFEAGSWPGMFINT